MHFGLNI